MSPENFCYWLNGWIELNKTIDHRGGATADTLRVIEDHLNLVFKKETPDRTTDKVLDLFKQGQQFPKQGVGDQIRTFPFPNTTPAPVTGPIAITC